MTPRILILLSLIASLGLAQDCLEYQDYLRITGGAYTSGSSYDVAVSGDFAYLVTYGYELLAFDISDPTGPAQLSSTPLIGHGRALDIEGGFAFVAEGDFGMEVFDLSSPASPVPAGSYALPPGWDMRAVDVEGNIAYAAVPHEGLHIIDVSDPHNPAPLSIVPLAYCEAQDVDIQGQYAYVAGSYMVGYEIWEAYLDIIDISAPSAPVRLGRHATQGVGRAVGAAGDYAYLSVDHPSGGPGGVYLRTVNVSDPNNPFAASTLNDEIDHPLWDMVLSGSRLYAAAWYQGFLVLDLSDPADPEFHSCLPTPDRGMGLALSDGLAYMASGYGGLQIIENLDAGNPIPQGSVDFDGYLGGLDVEDGIACAASGGDYGLQILDVADPQLLGGLPMPGPAEDVAIWNDYAIVADGDIQIVDISSPASPALLTSVATPGFAGALTLQAPLIFVADGTAGICIIDGSSQTIIGSEASAGFARGLKVDGDRLFVADEYGGLYILDVSDPAAPQLLGNYPVPPGCNGRAVTSSGDIVYLGVRSGSTISPSALYILDVSSPAAPVLLATEDSLNDNDLLGLDLVLDGDHVYLGHGDIQVIDVSDPLDPFTVGVSLVQGACTGIDTWNGSFHALSSRSWSHGTLSISLLQCADATAIDSNPAANSRRLANYPNPFNPKTILSFTLDEGGPVALRVYDIGGRERACLVDASLQAGEHRYTWDGRDEAGRPVSSGIYFARLAAGGALRTQKLVLLR